MLDKRVYNINWYAFKAFVLTLYLSEKKEIILYDKN